MNNRIKQLKDQALKECLDKSDNLVQGDTITLREFHNLVEDRFAELVIQKCISAVVSVPLPNEYEQQCADAVRKYFGIEL